MSELYRFRGHATGLLLHPVVARDPRLASRGDAEELLRRALDAEAEARREAFRTALSRAIAEWKVEARALRRAKLRKGRSARLSAIVADLRRLVVLIPDGGAILERAVPRSLWVRLAWPQPEAALEEQALEDLERALLHRLDPALARAMGRDEAVEAALRRIAVEPAAGPALGRASGRAEGRDKS